MMMQEFLQDSTILALTSMPRHYRQEWNMCVLCYLFYFWGNYKMWDVSILVLFLFLFEGISAFWIVLWFNRFLSLLSLQHFTPIVVPSSTLLDFSLECGYASPFILSHFPCAYSLFEIECSSELSIFDSQPTQMHRLLSLLVRRFSLPIDWPIVLHHPSLAIRLEGLI